MKQLHGKNGWQANGRALQTMFAGLWSLQYVTTLILGMNIGLVLVRYVMREQLFTMQHI